ncbi:hypothetical protein KFK09_007491 [Dendrobium nobile]|uniref:Uncharacterized protein n=1 Tax=Dendrobium nobile TaxID=94219 RepID=A0A8T3BVD6_DENNO|nr:hypothetical protein KFK09_007491 [Dendrobium nobile]
MTNRIHPKAYALESPKSNVSTTVDSQSPPTPPAPPVTLTVWRKSLLFNCKGFTVFDAEGNLVFRVDKYDRIQQGRDHPNGRRRKSPPHNPTKDYNLTNYYGALLNRESDYKLSLGKHWEIYDGEESANPRFSVKKHVNFLQPKSLAQVIRCDGGSLVYEVEGSYTQRCCALYDETRMAVVEIRRKEEVGGVDLGLDVFRLVVQPGFDAALAMAFVVLLEEMFGSRSLVI